MYFFFQCLKARQREYFFLRWGELISIEVWSSTLELFNTWFTFQYEKNNFSLLQTNDCRFFANNHALYCEEKMRNFFKIEKGWSPIFYVHMAFTNNIQHEYQCTA